MNLSPTQEKVILRLGDGDRLWLSFTKRHQWEGEGSNGPQQRTLDALFWVGLIRSQGLIATPQVVLTPLGQKTYEELKKK